jgi:outer membrane protein OmpA-like peptidoglycan-associated protein
LYQPEIGNFAAKINTPAGLKNWEFHAYQNDVQLIKMSFTEPKTSITWNWLNDTGDKITDISQLDYAIEITDSDSRTFESPRKSLPISQATESSIMAEANQDTIFEKFSLVLFDYNSSQLSESNMYLMQKVLARYFEHPDATMNVYGYSDTIGDENYNQKLSMQRAKTAYDILVRMKIPKEKLSYVGYGEINPIFSNASPEGRFLNRTVQIYIRYPKPVEE